MADEDKPFAIVFKKLDELLSPEAEPARPHPFDLSRQEADEIDELRRLASEIAEGPAPEVGTSTNPPHAARRQAGVVPGAGRPHRPSLGALGLACEAASGIASESANGFQVRTVSVLLLLG
jgi:hypothetical protein